MHGFTWHRVPGRASRLMWHRVLHTARRVMGRRVMERQVTEHLDRRTEHPATWHRRPPTERRAMGHRGLPTGLLPTMGLLDQCTPHRPSMSSKNTATHPIMRQSTCRGHLSPSRTTVVVAASSIAATVDGHTAIEAAPCEQGRFKYTRPPVLVPALRTPEPSDWVLKNWREESSYVQTASEREFVPRLAIGVGWRRLQERPDLMVGSRQPPPVSYISFPLTNAALP
jgi:hypothetical protein